MTVREGPLAAVVIVAIVVVGVALGGRFAVPEDDPPVASPLAAPSLPALDATPPGPSPAAAPPETPETPEPTADPRRSATGAPAPGPGIPEAFGGRWTGTMHNPIYQRRFPLAVELVAGAERAEVRWDDGLRCVGRLSLRESTETELTMDLDVSQRDCSPGRVSITRVGDGRLEYALRHRHDGELRYSGVLRPQE